MQALTVALHLQALKVLVRRRRGRGFLLKRAADPPQRGRSVHAKMEEGVCLVLLLRTQEEEGHCPRARRKKRPPSPVTSQRARVRRKKGLAQRGNAVCVPSFSLACSTTSPARSALKLNATPDTVRPTLFRTALSRYTALSSRIEGYTTSLLPKMHGRRGSK